MVGGGRWWEVVWWWWVEGPGGRWCRVVGLGSVDDSAAAGTRPVARAWARGRGGGEGPLGGRRCVERLWLAALALRAAAIHVPAAASALPVAGTELRALTGSMELP